MDCGRGFNFRFKQQVRCGSWKVAGTEPGMLCKEQEESEIPDVMRWSQGGSPKVFGGLCKSFSTLLSFEEFNKCWECERRNAENRRRREQMSRPVCPGIKWSRMCRSTACVTHRHATLPSKLPVLPQIPSENQPAPTHMYHTCIHTHTCLNHRGGNTIRLNGCVVATYAAGSPIVRESNNDQTLTHNHTHTHTHVEIGPVVI